MRGGAQARRRGAGQHERRGRLRYPLEREPESVLGDVLDGYVSIETARRDYGVVIEPGGLAVDEKMTAQLR